jgi:hypothetical protein
LLKIPLQHGELVKICQEKGVGVHKKPFYPLVMCST